MLKSVRGPVTLMFLLASFGGAMASQTPAGGSPVVPPERTPSTPRALYFSGFVTEKDDASITVSRKGMGKDTVRRSFILDAQTKVEGNLKVTARVTVRYESTANGDHASRILVRRAADEAAH